jgi:PAS domain S-box-containing protein
LSGSSGTKDGQPDADRETVAESEARLRSIADNSPDIITRFDRGLRHLYANPAAASASGRQPGDLVGRTNRELGLPLEIVDFWEEQLLRVFATGERGKMEFSFPGPSGIAYYEALIVPEKTADGSVETILCFTREVTARTTAELALREADRRKTRFLAVLSHELRNPLASIRLGVDLLQSVPRDANKAARALEVIERQTHNMTRLLRDLLDITRISEDKVRLELGPLDLAALARSTADDYQAAFDAAGVALEIVAGDAPVWVNGDEVRLCQIIGNLLQNAVRFTGRGGMAELAVYRDDTRNEAVIRLSDDGIGIASEALEGIFEPFMQVDDSLDRTGAGLGLGLALVKGFAKLHGGSAEAKSAGLGRGATFLVRLPGIPPAETRSAGGSPEPSAPTRRILVIEDNVDAAVMLREVLALLGHEVETAATGASGIEKARTFRPEVVLCDIGLPGVNGYDVARAMRANPVLRHLLLVALSGYGQPEDLEASREAGFDRHLVKPVSLADLQAVLNAAPLAR